MKKNALQGQAAVEYILVTAALALIGFMALQAWAGALGKLLKNILKWRSGELGMLP